MPVESEVSLVTLKELINPKCSLLGFTQSNANENGKGGTQAALVTQLDLFLKSPQGSGQKSSWQITKSIRTGIVIKPKKEEEWGTGHTLCT